VLRRLKLLLAGGLLLLCLTPALPVYAAEENVFQDACTVPGAADSEACKVSGANPITGTNGTIAKASRLIAYIAGVAAIIIMIVAGIMYILSSGDPQKVASAKNTFLYALIGLVVVVAAQTIIVFVLNSIK